MSFMKSSVDQSLPGVYDYSKALTKSFEERLSIMGIDAVIVKKPSDLQMRRLVEEGYDVYGDIYTYLYDPDITKVYVTCTISKIRPCDNNSTEFINDEGRTWQGIVIGVAHESHSSDFVRLYLSTMEERGHTCVFLNDKEYSEIVDCTESPTSASSTSVSPNTLYCVTQE
jgi:hypothetical protein